VRKRGKMKGGGRRERKEEGVTLSARPMTSEAGMYVFLESFSVAKSLSENFV